MNSINYFSFRRLFQLVGMELKIRYKSILLFSGIILGLFLGFSLLDGYVNREYQSGDYVMMFDMIFTLVMLSFVFYFAHTMNRRIRSSDTLAYSAIPASVEEKFISIISLGIIHFLLAWCVAQLAMWGLIMINPTVKVALESQIIEGAQIVDFHKNGLFFYYDPIIFLKIINQGLIWLILTAMLYGIVCSKAAFGFSATSWIDKLIILSAYIFAVAPIHLWGTNYMVLKYYPIFSWVMSIGLLIASYLRLRKIEQL
ncbi:hypothetical protein QYZ87_08255 [Porphyromonadaceae bacterium W3.11]|nr:hypothetical protein [Porphyromonadaceae bacterium W3.11]